MATVTQAAGLLAAMAAAEHSAAARLLDQRLDSLAAATATMAASCGPETPNQITAQVSSWISVLLEAHVSSLLALTLSSL